MNTPHNMQARHNRRITNLAASAASAAQAAGLIRPLAKLPIMPVPGARVAPIGGKIAMPSLFTIA